MSSVVSLESTRGREFGRFVKVLALTRGDFLGAQRVAENRGWLTTATVLKALVNPIGTSDLQNGMGPVVNDMAEVLRPLTIIGRFQGLRRVAFRTRMLRQDAGGAGAFVGEGAPIPVTELDLSDTATLDPKRVSGIRVITEELARVATSGSDQMVARDASGSLIEAKDVAFIDPANNGTADKPASITSGAQSYSSSGSTIAAIDADLKLLLAVLTAADCNLSTAAWIMSPISAAFLATLRGSGGAPAFNGVTARGGLLLGLPVLTSTHVTATGSPGERFITLAEASEIMIADDGEGNVELSTRASVQMSDTPLAGAQQLVSLWQLNLVGIKATQFVNWQRRRDGAVAVLRNVNW